MGMNNNHPVTQSEVIQRIERMSFSEKRQYWLDWDLLKPGYPYKAWLHQRCERLIHQETDRHNATYY